VAAELAVAFPERVERLALVDAAGIVPAARERRRAVALLEVGGFLGARFAANYRSVAARPRLRRLALRMVAHRPERLRADLVLAGLLTQVTPAYRHALRAAVDYLSYDWNERLRTIRRPTLVVWGDRDAIIPVGHGEKYVKLIPGARSLVLPDTGHVPMVERPHTFNRELLAFLRSEEGPRTARPTP
jgi:pimeloyl-ACP methyl ester carboxylesterase